MYLSGKLQDLLAPRKSASNLYTGSYASAYGMEYRNSCYCNFCFSLASDYCKLLQMLCREKGREAGLDSLYQYASLNFFQKYVHNIARSKHVNVPGNIE